MHPSFVPPCQVTIGDAASFAGTTPRAIRHYHQLGLLPETERGDDDRRRYGYDEMIRPGPPALHGIGRRTRGQRVTGFVSCRKRDAFR